MKNFLCVFISIIFVLTTFMGAMLTVNALPESEELPIRSVIMREKGTVTDVPLESCGWGYWDTFKSKAKNNSSTYAGVSFDYTGKEIERYLLDENCYFPNNEMMVFNIPVNKTTTGSIGPRARNPAGVSPSWREVNVTAWLDKAFIVADIWLGDETNENGNYTAANVDDLLILSGRGNDSYQNVLFGIPLSDYYSQADVGTIKRVKVPLSAFSDSENLYGIGQSTMDYTRVLTFGVGYKHDTIKYDMPMLAASPIS